MIKWVNYKDNPNSRPNKCLDCGCISVIGVKKMTIMTQIILMLITSIVRNVIHRFIL
jgi:hypothetical protein